MQYGSLHDLVNLDSKAREYFDDLPAYIQDQISARSNSVNTFEGLQDYAEKLLLSNPTSNEQDGS